MASITQDIELGDSYKKESVSYFSKIKGVILSMFSWIVNPLPSHNDTLYQTTLLPTHIETRS